MASTTLQSLRSLANKGRWIFVPVALFIASRFIYGVILHVASDAQESTYPYLGGTVQVGYHVYSPSEASPGYWGVIANWDGQWYQQIAEAGYPVTDDPRDARSQWRWAFPPLYPLLVGGVMRLTSLPFQISASAVTIVFGLLASVLLYALIREVSGALVAGVGTWFVVNAPAAPLLQVAYSESAALALLAAILLLIRRRHYTWVALLILLLGLTRLITPPLFLVLLMHALQRTRSGDPLRPREKVTLGAALMSSLVAVFLWPQVAQWLGAGIDNRATRHVSTLGGYFVQFWSLAPFLAVGLVAALWLLFRYVTTGRVRRFGIEMQSWALAYPIFVLLVTSATSGLVRYMLLAFPLWASFAPRVSRKRASWLWVLVASILMVGVNYLWVRHLFIVDHGGRDMVFPP